MTIYVPVWLYWYGGLPLALVVGYLLGRLHKPATASPGAPYRDKEVEEHIARRRAMLADKEAVASPGYKPLQPPAYPTNEAPTTKRAIPAEQPATTWDEDAS